MATKQETAGRVLQMPQQGLNGRDLLLGTLTTPEKPDARRSIAPYFWAVLTYSLFWAIAIRVMRGC